MHYINPYDLLEINAENLSEIDSATINRAKRKLLAEIELSDTNTITHCGLELNKGDCLRAIDDLDIKDKKEFHFFIYQHKHLKLFLTKGKLSFFENYQTESIYKLPEFLDFISQFFAEQYDKVLLENYKQWNHEAVAKILSVKPITNDAYYEKCYKSTYAHVKEIDNEVNDIIKSVANNKSPYIAKKFSGLDKVLIEKVNVPLLNLLPTYFQSLRNQLALSIRNLARDINNDPYSLYEPAFKVIDIANNISTDALTHQTITKGYYTIKKNYEDDLTKLKAQKQTTADNQLLSWWRKKSSQIDAITQEIEDGESNYINSNFYALDTAVYEIADPTKLNSLPSSFQNVKNEIAASVRSLAITVNNEPHHKHKVAYDLISIAYSINADGDIAEKISSAYTVIKRNFDKQVGQQYSKSKYDSSSQQTKAQEPKEESKEEKSNWAYRIFLAAFVGLMIWALFNSTVQIVILSLSALFFGIRIYNLIKKPENFTNEKTIDKFFFLLSAIVCIGGFFYQPLALLYISYNMLVWAHQLYCDVVLNKKYKNERSIGYLLIALLITLSFMAYQKNQSVTINSPAASSSPQIDNTPSSSSNSNYSSPSTDNSNSYSSPSNNTYTAPEPPPPPKPVYTFPYLSNGNITGCSNIHARYNKNIDNKLIISCGSNADVAVKMIDYSTDKSIRYVYIHKNTTYTIRNIPEGKYYLKIAYGDDWGVKAGESNCEGRFTSNSLFKKGEEVLDYNLIYEGDGSYQVPSFSLRLNVIFTTNDNSDKFSTDNISENDFYNE